MQTVKDYLKMAGMTQDALARRAMIDPGQLSRLLNSQQEPTLAVLRRLSVATGISIERLVRDFK